MAISNATKLAGYVGAAITGDGATGIITAITFSGTATNAANLGIGATGYGLVLSGDLTAANVTVGDAIQVNVSCKLHPSPAATGSAFELW